MGIVDRIRGRSDRSESRLRFESEAARQERSASTKTKAKRDVRRAKAAARAKAAEVKRKAKRDARRAGAAARERAREEASEVRTAGNPSAPETTEEVFRLAGDAAQLRSPVDATLEPSPGGPGMEQFTRGVSNPESGPDGSAEGMISAGFITGEKDAFADANDSGDGEEVEENPLEFSDDFGVGSGKGGTWL